jgi:hypothetical protein
MIHKNTMLTAFLQKHSPKEIFHPVMTLPQCTIELPNNEVSDTTDVDSSNSVHYIIINFIKRTP